MQFPGQLEMYIRIVYRGGMHLLSRCFLYLVLAKGALTAELALTISAESAVLMNADTGKILYQKKAHEKLFPASITKIATCAYVLQNQGDKLDEVLTAEQDCIGSVTEEAKMRSKYKLPSHWLVTDCSHIGIKRGEKMTRKDLLYGMMLSSADDASNVLAYNFNGSIPEFMKGLNAYLTSLGCKNTYFNNPHGLHHPEHVTTAYDMAVMSCAALKIPHFQEIVSTVRYTRPKTNMQEPSVLLQTNKLLRKGELYYPRAIGIKTGWHSKASSTLVAAAKENDRTLVAVLMNVKDRKVLFQEAIKLFDAAFSQPKMKKTLVKAGPQKYSYTPEGVKNSVGTYAATDFTLAYYPAEEPQVRAYLAWKNLPAPLQKGQELGSIQLKDELGRILGSVPLFASEDLKTGFGQAIKDYVSNRPATMTIFVVLLAILIFGLIFRKLR
jgi:D-alanyl-D-alanine carboxypeptidase (penicillin-binding protein 5/6)